MAGSTKGAGLKARVFEGKWEPRVGQLCLVTLDTGDRPFLPVMVSAVEAEGWLFPAGWQDDISSDLRVRGLGPGERRSPCYCKFARAALSAV